MTFDIKLGSDIVATFTNGKIDTENASILTWFKTGVPSQTSLILDGNFSTVNITLKPKDTNFLEAFVTHLISEGFTIPKKIFMKIVGL